MFNIFLDPPKSAYRPGWSVNVSCFPGIIVSYDISPFKRYKNKTDSQKSLGYMAAVYGGGHYQVEYTVFPANVDLFVYFLNYHDNFYKPLTRGIYPAGVDCDGYHGYVDDGETIYWKPELGIWTSKHYQYGIDYDNCYEDDIIEVFPIITTDRFEFFMYKNVPYFRDKVKAAEKKNGL